MRRQVKSGIDKNNPQSNQTAAPANQLPKQTAAPTNQPPKQTAAPTNQLAKQAAKPLQDVTPRLELENNGYHLDSYERLEAIKDMESCFERGHRLANGFGVLKDPDKGWKLMLEAAREGHPVALALCFTSGTETIRDDKRAVGLLKESATRGHPVAQFNLGVCYIQGVGVDKNFSEAVRNFKLAADSGFPAAQFNLGNCYGSGIGVSKDYALAAIYFKKAAELGRQDARSALSIALGRFADEMKPELLGCKSITVSWSTSPPDTENSEAKVVAYARYMYGIGIERNEALAKRILFDAAMERHPIAIAVCIIESIEFERNEKNLRLAISLLKAFSRNAQASFHLGLCYANGIGVETDNSMSVSCFNDAMTKGNVAALFHYARALENGTGINQDMEHALNIYKDAALKGCSEAQFKMGIIYRDGALNVTQDPKNAYGYIQAASRLDHPEANRLLCQLPTPMFSSTPFTLDNPRPSDPQSSLSPAQPQSKSQQSSLHKEKKKSDSSAFFTLNNSRPSDPQSPLPPAKPQSKSQQSSPHREEKKSDTIQKDNHRQKNLKVDIFKPDFFRDSESEMRRILSNLDVFLYKIKHHMSWLLTSTNADDIGYHQFSLGDRFLEYSNTLRQYQNLDKIAVDRIQEMRSSIGNCAEKAKSCVNKLDKAREDFTLNEMPRITREILFWNEKMNSLIESLPLFAEKVRAFPPLVRKRKVAMAPEIIDFLERMYQQSGGRLEITDDVRIRITRYCLTHYEALDLEKRNRNIVEDSIDIQKAQKYLALAKNQQAKGEWPDAIRNYHHAALNGSTEAMYQIYLNSHRLEYRHAPIEALHFLIKAAKKDHQQAQGELLTLKNFVNSRDNDSSNQSEQELNNLLDAALYYWVDSSIGANHKLISLLKLAQAKKCTSNEKHPSIRSVQLQIANALGSSTLEGLLDRMIETIGLICDENPGLVAITDELQNVRSQKDETAPEDPTPLNELKL